MTVDRPVEKTRQVDRDRTELARALIRLGMDRDQVADVVGAPPTLLFRVLAGGRL